MCGMGEKAYPPRRQNPLGPLNGGKECFMSWAGLGLQQVDRWQ